MNLLGSRSNARNSRSRVEPRVAPTCLSSSMIDAHVTSRPSSSSRSFTVQIRSLSPGIHTRQLQPFLYGYVVEKVDSLRNEDADQASTGIELRTNLRVF